MTTFASTFGDSRTQTYMGLVRMSCLAQDAYRRQDNDVYGAWASGALIGHCGAISTVGDEDAARQSERGISHPKKPWQIPSPMPCAALHPPNCPPLPPPLPHPL